MVDTGAAIVDIARTGAIDRCRELPTLAISGVGVCFHGAIRDFAGWVGVEKDCGCGGDDDILVETEQG